MKSNGTPLTTDEQLRDRNDLLPTLESVLCTEELHRRPPRAPDYETENHALVSLAQALIDSPQTILQALSDMILKVFQCDSAGVSLVTEDEKRFHWPAIAGVWKPHIGGGTPRDFGPCGDVLDRNAPLLFKHFEQRYTYFLPVTPPVEECLLVPFYVEGEAVGTIWAIAHDERRKFDSEDLRMLVSLGTFASAAYQAEGQWHALSEQAHEREVAAQALREINDALLVSSVRQHELTEQAQRANIAADEANLAKDIFLATLSHEMRTPLSAILGWMHILHGGRAGGCGDAELSEGLEVIERNARAMAQLLDDVMDVSRIVSGKLRLEVRPCELSAVIRAGIDVVRSAAQAKDITLSAELDPAASAVSCDAARLQQVIWNLLSNAVKFTPKGGAVRVTLARQQSDLRIAVSDSGQGIGPELLPYVFDRFRQADNSTRRRFGGLGLGLSIVKHLVELHGGTVQAESAGAGKGATFTVLLPIRAIRTDESGEESGADDSEPFAPTGLPLVRLDGLRVLVVDDEPDARRLLVKVLHEAGAVVTAAASAAEAIEALATANPDVLVSDLGMADQDGYDLIRQVRSSGHNAKDLPAVALTAFVHKNDRRQALLAGFQTHVPKPADPHDLTAVIASLAGRTGPAS